MAMYCDFLHNVITNNSVYLGIFKGRICISWGNNELLNIICSAFEGDAAKVDFWVHISAVQNMKWMLID